MIVARSCGSKPNHGKRGGLSSSGRTHEIFRAGLKWRKLVKLFKKQDSSFYWYDFNVRGKRFRGSKNSSRPSFCEYFRFRILNQVLCSRSVT
jgi:hypothetical protein